MRKNKAFTLIELIAVIVVIAIIALITIPNISGYIQNTKKESFKVSVNSLISAYNYKTIDQGLDLGRVTACSLDITK